MAYYYLSIIEIMTIITQKSKVTPITINLVYSFSVFTADAATLILFAVNKHSPIMKAQNIIANNDSNQLPSAQ